MVSIWQYKMELYTSCYDKIFLKEKKENDIYIQVSRNLGKYSDTEKVNLIDEDWGLEFGNWGAANEKEYKSQLSKKDLRIFSNHIRELNNKRIFLLCFENVLIGETCHRIWLSKVLARSFGLKFSEYTDS